MLLHSSFFSNRIYADLTFITAFAFKFYTAFNFSVDGVVLTHTYVVAGMEFSTALTNDDAAGGYQLAVMSFGTQTLCVRVTTVVGATSTFFMCMKLQK